MRPGLVIRTVRKEILYFSHYYINSNDLVSSRPQSKEYGKGMKAKYLRRCPKEGTSESDPTLFVRMRMRGTKPQQGKAKARKIYQVCPL